MAADALDGLKQLDRDALVERMAVELPGIRKDLKVTQEALVEKTGVDATSFLYNTKCRG